MESIDEVTVVDGTTGSGRKVKLDSPDNSLGVKVGRGAMEAVRVKVGVACVVVEIMLKEIPSPVIVNDIGCVCVETLVSPSVSGGV